LIFTRKFPFFSILKFLTKNLNFDICKKISNFHFFNFEIFNKSRKFPFLFSILRLARNFHGSEFSRIRNFPTLCVGLDEDIGVEIMEVYDSEWAEIRGLSSIRIKSVTKYSPAYRARLLPEDRITHIAGISVTTTDLIPYMFHQHSRGGSIIIGYIPSDRNNAEHRSWVFRSLYQLYIFNQNFDFY